MSIFQIGVSNLLKDFCKLILMILLNYLYRFYFSYYFIDYLHKLFLHAFLLNNLCSEFLQVSFLKLKSMF